MYSKLGKFFMDHWAEDSDKFLSYDIVNARL